MNRLAMALVIIVSAACVLTITALSSGPEALPAHTAAPQTNPPPTPVASTPSGQDDVKGGVPRGTDTDGAVLQFPLKHTDVRAEVTGNIAQVELTQIFQNPYKKKIEAVYVFPLPNRAVVNAMEVKIGERTIEATIKKRDDAQRIYEETGPLDTSPRSSSKSGRTSSPSRSPTSFSETPWKSRFATSRRFLTRTARTRLVPDGRGSPVHSRRAIH